MTDRRKELGKSGEDLAVAYLQNNCYTIVERNYRCRTGEVDIIARKDDILFFIEVTKLIKECPFDSATPYP